MAIHFLENIFKSLLRPSSICFLLLPLFLPLLLCLPLHLILFLLFLQLSDISSLSSFTSTTYSSSPPSLLVASSQHLSTFFSKINITSRYTDCYLCTLSIFLFVFFFSCRFLPYARTPFSLYLPPSLISVILLCVRQVWITVCASNEPLMSDVK